MMDRLSRRPAGLSELAQPLSMFRPTVMQQTGVLEAAKLVRDCFIAALAEQEQCPPLAAEPQS